MHLASQGVPATSTTWFNPFQPIPWPAHLLVTIAIGFLPSESVLWHWRIYYNIKLRSSLNRHLEQLAFHCCWHCSVVPQCSGRVCQCIERCHHSWVPSGCKIAVLHDSITDDIGLIWGLVRGSRFPVRIPHGGLDTEMQLPSWFLGGGQEQEWGWCLFKLRVFVSTIKSK